MFIVRFCNHHQQKEICVGAVPVRVPVPAYVNVVVVLFLRLSVQEVFISHFRVIEYPNIDDIVDPIVSVNVLFTVMSAVSVKIVFEEGINVKLFTVQAVQAVVTLPVQANVPVNAQDSVVVYISALSVFVQANLNSLNAIFAHTLYVAPFE